MRVWQLARKKAGASSQCGVFPRRMTGHALLSLSRTSASRGPLHFYLKLGRERRKHAGRVCLREPFPPRNRTVSIGRRALTHCKRAADLADIGNARELAEQWWEAVIAKAGFEEVMKSVARKGGVMAERRPDAT